MEASLVHPVPIIASYIPYNNVGFFHSYDYCLCTNPDVHSIICIDNTTGVYYDTVVSAMPFLAGFFYST